MVDTSTSDPFQDMFDNNDYDDINMEVMVPPEAAQIDLSSGNRVVLSSEKGIFDMLEQRSTLQGNVVITTSTGYEITTEALTANFQTLALESPGSVVAIGPIGTFNAGKMRLVRRNNKESAHLIFTNGVKLVYRPRHTKE